VTSSLASEDSKLIGQRVGSFLPKLQRSYFKTIFGQICACSVLRFHALHSANCHAARCSYVRPTVTVKTAEYVVEILSPPDSTPFYTVSQKFLPLNIGS